MSVKIKFPGLPTDPGEPAGGFYDGEVPPTGTYKGRLKFLRVKENRNGDLMFNGVVEIAEPKNSKKKEYNGYGAWFNQNITEQGAPYLNQFLNALGAKYSDVLAGNVLADDNEDPPRVVRIGRFKVGDNPIVIVGRKGEYNGQDRLEIQRFMSAKDEEPDEDEDEDEYDEEELEDEESDEDEEDESDEDEEEEDEDEDEEEEEGYTAEDLEGMAILELKAILKDAGWVPSDYKGYTRDDLVEAILGEDVADEEDEEGEDDEPPF